MDEVDFFSTIVEEVELTPALIGAGRLSCVARAQQFEAGSFAERECHAIHVRGFAHEPCVGIGSTVGKDL